MAFFFSFLAVSLSHYVQRSPYHDDKSALLITKKSDFVIPGPPFLGIFSPPETSIT